MNISHHQTLPAEWLPAVQANQLSPLIGLFVFMTFISLLLDRLLAIHKLPPGPKRLPFFGSLHPLSDFVV